MAEEDGEPIRRSRDWALAELVREDLELYSASDLEERIEVLGAEIGRTRAEIERRAAKRAAADAFFAKRG